MTRASPTAVHPRAEAPRHEDQAEPRLRRLGRCSAVTLRSFWLSTSIVEGVYSYESRSFRTFISGACSCLEVADGLLSLRRWRFATPA